MQYSQFQIKISVCGVSGYKNDRSFAGYCSKTYFIVEHTRLTVGLQSPIIPLRLFHRTIRVPHCQGIGCSPNCERIREWHGFVTIEDIDEGPRHCDMSECPSMCTIHFRYSLLVTRTQKSSFISGRTRQCRRKDIFVRTFNVIVIYFT